MVVGNVQSDEVVPGILDFSRALELNPRIADQVYNKVYQISYVVDLNRVITELNKIVSDHPNESHVVFLRGFFYVAKTEFKQVGREDLNKGITDFNRCLELNPQHVTAYLYRGFLHMKMASKETRPKERKAWYARAMKDYKHALVLDPVSGISHYLQALCWSTMSTEEGLDAAEIALSQVSDLVHGSTVATNAILERKGARVAFLVTKGFRDILFLQRHNRRSIYDLKYQKPAPVVARRDILEIAERIDGKGQVVTDLDAETCGAAVRDFLAGDDFGAVAICLLNGYLNPDHEKRLAELVRAAVPGLAPGCIARLGVLCGACHSTACFSPSTPHSFITRLSRPASRYTTGRILCCFAYCTGSWEPYRPCQHCSPCLG